MIEPTKISEESDNELLISWSDNTDSLYNARSLRIQCPCAGCIDEWTGEKRLDESKIPEEITFTKISLVGRYALNFVFSDGHDTGIYSFDLLRKLNKAVGGGQ